jgi:hypothetical protein
MIEEVRHRLEGLARLVMTGLKRARRRTATVFAQWEARGRRRWAAH